MSAPGTWGVDWGGAWAGAWGARPIRVAMVGTGFVAPHHAAGWRACAGVELVAAAIRDPGTYRPVAGRIADRFHGWIAARLDGTSDEAFRLLAQLEGYALLRMAGRP